MSNNPFHHIGISIVTVVSATVTHQAVLVNLLTAALVSVMTLLVQDANNTALNSAMDNFESNLNLYERYSAFVRRRSAVAPDSIKKTSLLAELLMAIHGIR